MADTNPMARGRSTAATGSRTALQKAAMLVAVVFVLVGVLGFIPFANYDFDRMAFAGVESETKLLNLFQVSVLHNLVHLGFGIVGLFLARSHRSARGFLIGGGAIYLVLWLYGLLVNKESTANFVPVNAADNWLHLGLGAGMLALGLLLTTQRADNLDNSHG